MRDLENHEQGPGNGCGVDEQQQEELKRLQQKSKTTTNPYSTNMYMMCCYS